MADLEKVLRTFALQKMLELKEKQNNEKEDTSLCITNEQGSSSNECVRVKDSSLSLQENIHTPSVSKGNECAGNEILSIKIEDGIQNVSLSVADGAKSEDTSSKVKDKSTPLNKDKKITIKLLTKMIEDESLKQEPDVKVESKDDSMSSSDDSVAEDLKTESNTSKKPWRKVYEEGELTMSSDSGDEGGSARKNESVSDEVKDKSVVKKLKKHKHKHKHKNHKHRDKTKDKEDSRIEDGNTVKHKSKKEHRRDKEHKGSRSSKEHRGKDAESETGRTDSKKDHRDDRRTKKKNRHRSRSRSPSSSRSDRKKRKRSRSRSQSRSQSRSRSRSPCDRFRSDRHSSWSRTRFSSQDLRHKLRRRSRSRSPCRDGFEDEFKIDKAKLLEIAKANAYSKIQSGELPPYMQLAPKSVVTKIGNKSVEELTAVCKEISSKQKNYSDSDDSPVNRPVDSDEDAEDEEGPFIRHPFKVREAPLGGVGIVLNIRNAIQKPIQDKEVLRLTFPVSSGSQHHKKEEELGIRPYGDWVAVENKPNMMVPVGKPTSKTTADAALAKATLHATMSLPPMSSTTTATTTPALMPPPPIPTAAPQILTTFAGIISPGVGTMPSTSAIAAASTIPASVAAAELAALRAVAAVSNAIQVTAARTTVTNTQATTVEDKVFEEVTTMPVDIAAMVSARLKAARRLEGNPNDVEALSAMHKAQTQIRNWTKGKEKPGMFTGDTGLRTLRPDQLANSNPKAQAWIRRDMFHNQAPLRGGVGAMLMAKMGWKQGEGLGKDNTGVLEPLALDIKTDRKGLVANDEQRQKKNQPPKAVFKDLSGKHPVSALMEICNKRRWAPPSFDLVHDNGPAHKKSFVFKVCINNEEYQSTVSCPNKKQAKAQAAAVALQKMGLIP